MQIKLTQWQIEKLKQAKEGIRAGLAWNSSDEGDEYWSEAVRKIDLKIEYGTSDGKPYVEPEPPIPEGYRKANADEWRRRDVKYWDLCHKDWRPRLSQGIAFDPPVMQTRYIVPIDPPLTDEDACVWPRLLVMVRDTSRWEGPFELQGVSKSGVYRYATNDPRTGICETYRQARRATPEEIEAAK